MISSLATVQSIAKYNQPTINPYGWTLTYNGFAPLSVTGCCLWVDGSDLHSVYQDQAGTVLVTTNSQNANFWQDKSNRRNFFVYYAKDKSFDALFPENWYTVQKKDLLLVKVRSPLSFSLLLNKNRVENLC